MGRKPRIYVAGGIYHVAVRGNRRSPIFVDKLDRIVHEVELAVTVEMYELILIAYVQMTNHVHLLVETVHPNLGGALQRLDGVYARRYNRRHAETDHLLRAHPSVTPVLVDGHCMELGRYFDLNPVRAGLCKKSADWRWGSHRAIVGLDPAPQFLTPDRILRYFGEDDRLARAAYRAFVAAGAGPKTDADLQAHLELAQPLARARLLAGVGHGVGHRDAAALRAHGG